MLNRPTHSVETVSPSRSLLAAMVRTVALLMLGVLQNADAAEPMPHPSVQPPRGTMDIPTQEFQQSIDALDSVRYETRHRAQMEMLARTRATVQEIGKEPAPEIIELPGQDMSENLGLEDIYAAVA